MCFFAVCLCQSLKFCVYLCLLLLKIWHSISISFLLIICIIFNEAFTYNVFDTTYKRVTCSSTLSGHPSSSLRFWSAKQSSSIGMQIELSLQSRAHFANFIFQKCCHPLRFLRFWRANRALATFLCTFSGQLSQIEACARRNRDLPSATPRASRLYPKNHRFSRPTMFSPVNSRVPELSLFSAFCSHTKCCCSLCYIDMMMMSWRPEVFELTVLWYLPFYTS